MDSHKNSLRLRVASYNIRKTRGLDQRYDPNRIVSVINGLGADLVALQEADHRLGDRPAALDARMVESETDFRVVEVAGNAVSLGWHGNAILLHKDISARSVARVDLPGLEPRGAVRVDIDIGVPVSVVATHLGLLRRHRRRQLGVIAAEVKGARRAVVLGDFNEWSSAQGLEPLGDDFTVHAPGLSFHAARPVGALDRIAVSASGDLADAGVEEGPLARRASDHLPVWADIRWQTS